MSYKIKKEITIDKFVINSTYADGSKKNFETKDEKEFWDEYFANVTNKEVVYFTHTDFTGTKEFLSFTKEFKPDKTSFLIGLVGLLVGAFCLAITTSLDPTVPKLLRNTQEISGWYLAKIVLFPLLVTAYSALIWYQAKYTHPITGIFDSAEIKTRFINDNMFKLGVAIGIGLVASIIVELMKIW